MATRKLAAKATVVALAVVAPAFLGTAPASADLIPPYRTGWNQEPITGPGCAQNSVCIWPNTDWIYTGRRFFGGPILPCHGVRFEGSYYMNKMLSFKNHASGSISFWNRAADGSYNYSRLGTFPSGAEIYNFTNGRYADAFVYDPHGDCGILTLDHYDIWQHTKVTLKVDAGGTTARAAAAAARPTTGHG
ncbi:hypothetical protein [Actinomadura sp. 9N407]|uniref:hypothetical protein n=1 Tax=Actinomadura sp. 9N407 TaxID=3375154 RepID=UPI0037BC760A